MGTDDRAAPALPVRRMRYRPTGRHRSPHQLSVPPEAPALVLAVPGRANAASSEIAAGIAAIARESCPGVAVRIGYLRGEELSLSSVLADFPSPEGRPPAVVLPLLTCADPVIDAAIDAAVAAAGSPAIVAGPLGPHPVLAAALHARLAEAGLARGERVGRISVVTAAEGVLVAALGGADAVPVAGTAAVLLAARLALPVAPAALRDSDSIKHGLARLEQAGVTQVALAPCVIGPEISAAELAGIAEAAGLKIARPLGAHTAIGQLAAMRYGTALQDPQLASLPGLPEPAPWRGDRALGPAWGAPQPDADGSDGTLP